MTGFLKGTKYALVGPAPRIHGVFTFQKTLAHPEKSPRAAEYGYGKGI